MIDFISSKLGLLLAGLLMLGMIAGLVNTIQEAGEKKAYARVAEDLADILSDVEAAPGELTATLVFKDDWSQNPGIHFPQFIGRDSYEIRISPDVVQVYDSNGDFRAMAYIAGEVHGWTECPSDSSAGLTSDEIDACDEAAPWTFSTDEPLFIEVKHDYEIVDSVQVLLTSVLPTSAPGGSE